MVLRCVLRALSAFSTVSKLSITGVSNGPAAAAGWYCGIALADLADFSVILHKLSVLCLVAGEFTAPDADFLGKRE
jgi:hypothetical protein